MQVGLLIDVPALSANIFAAAINRPTRQNKADSLGSYVDYLNKVSMDLTLFDYKK
jgi:hypothetical protein